MVKINNKFDPSEILTCQRCLLKVTRRQVVLGRGYIPADLLLLGEAPGRTEDLRGEAFIGKAGKLLDQMIIDACKLEKDCPLFIPRMFITNVVLCHPTDSFAGPNREPKAEEVFLCKVNITKIVETVKPKIIVFVGDIARQYYKKEYGDLYHITHPAALSRVGGIKAPNYLMNIRNLHEIFKKVQPKFLKRVN